MRVYASLARSTIGHCPIHFSARFGIFQLNKYLARPHGITLINIHDDDSSGDLGCKLDDHLCFHRSRRPESPG